MLPHPPSEAFLAAMSALGLRPEEDSEELLIAELRSIDATIAANDSTIAVTDSLSKEGVSL